MFTTAPEEFSSEALVAATSAEVAPLCVTQASG